MNIRTSLVSLVYILAMVIVVLFVASLASSKTASEIITIAIDIFGFAFLLPFCLLVLLSLYALSKLKLTNNAKRSYYLELGLQSASGIATLALTFTLLGISLGIATLADKPISPEHIATIISELTKQFNLAFMTTVVGLPTSALLRAILIINNKQLTLKQT